MLTVLSCLGGPPVVGGLAWPCPRFHGRESTILTRGLDRQTLLCKAVLGCHARQTENGGKDARV